MVMLKEKMNLHGMIIEMAMAYCALVAFIMVLSFYVVIRWNIRGSRKLHEFNDNGETRKFYLGCIFLLSFIGTVAICLHYNM